MQETPVKRENSPKVYAYRPHDCLTCLNDRAKEIWKTFHQFTIINRSLLHRRLHIASHVNFLLCLYNSHSY